MRGQLTNVGLRRRASPSESGQIYNSSARRGQQEKKKERTKTRVISFPTGRLVSRRRLLGAGKKKNTETFESRRFRNAHVRPQNRTVAAAR